jgi:predicted metal-dependent hydrolase
MRLPKELRDYVILHELAHTVEKNHQPPFWNFLDTLTEGNAKKLDKELKNYTTRIF